MTRRQSSRNPLVLLDYYNFAFAALIEQLKRDGYDSTRPPEVRHWFWRQVPNDTYAYLQARSLVLAYAKRVEQEIAAIVSKQSVAYWLHLFRRLAPTRLLPNMPDQTVHLVRLGVEAAIQKYGTHRLCDRIASSDEIEVGEILGGVLLDSHFKPIREMLAKHPQLVLARFGPAEMLEAFELDKLSFEMWRCGANLRTIGKGGTLLVGSGLAFESNTSPELDRLIESYDRRKQAFETSATGVVFGGVSDRAGTMLLARLNVREIPLADLNPFLGKTFRVSVPENIPSNFTWELFNIASYVRAHAPFSEGFVRKHRVFYEDIIVALAALSLWSYEGWVHEGFPAFWRDSQRSYSTPLPRQALRTAVWLLWDSSAQRCGLSRRRSKRRIARTLRFLSLDARDRGSIDLLLRGPLAILLPVDKGGWVIDYAWFPEVLYWLFYGVRLDDQQFKGTLLEDALQREGRCLPRKPCKAADGTSKQIDASFGVGDLLVVVEAKSKGKSLAIDRGDKAAFDLRQEFLDSALSAVDEKVLWLARNPVGRNYDVSKFQSILGVVASPFKEFIWSERDKYWITRDLPRVLTPRELQEATNEEQFTQLDKLWNTVRVSA